MDFSFNNISVLTKAALDKDRLQNALGDATGPIKDIINIVMGSIAGLLGLALIILGIVRFVMLSKTGSEEKRKKILTSLKWLGIAFVGILAIWIAAPVFIGIFEGNLAAKK